MSEQIFLHWHPSEAVSTISRTLERSLLRVLTWRLIEVDVIQSTSSVYEFGSYSFQYTYSVESYSNHFVLSWLIDATALHAHLMSQSEYIQYDLSKLADSSNTMIIQNGLFNGNSVTSFNISNNGVLKRIVIGNDCFGKVRVFELDGLGELESVEIGRESFRISGGERSDGSYRIVNCPKLKSIQIGYRSFSDYHSFELNNLPSLQSIDMGYYCFYYAPSFSLTSVIDGLVWIHRSSSTTISQTWWVGILSCLFDCVWEWLNGWIDDSDLPKLQSIQLDYGALEGDWRDNRKTISDEPYNFKNTLTMRSEIEWVDEWIDLPSLIEFKGDYYNLERIGSVILDSIDLVFDWCRYPSIVIQWNLLPWWLLQIHLFPPILKYPFSHFLIIRCHRSRIIHQTRKRLRLIDRECFLSTQQMTVW